MFVLAREDVAEVLEAHGVPSSPDLIDWVFEDREGIVRRINDIDEEDFEAARHLVEEFYFENKVLYGNRKFPNPYTRTSRA